MNRKLAAGFFTASFFSGHPPPSFFFKVKVSWAGDIVHIQSFLGRRFKLHTTVPRFTTARRKQQTKRYSVFDIAKKLKDQQKQQQQKKSDKDSGNPADPDIESGPLAINTANPGTGSAPPATTLPIMVLDLLVDLISASGQEDEEHSWKCSGPVWKHWQLSL